MDLLIVQGDLCLPRVCCGDVENILESLMVTHNKSHLEFSNSYTIPIFYRHSIHRVDRSRELNHRVRFPSLDVAA